MNLNTWRRRFVKANINQGIMSIYIFGYKECIQYMTKKITVTEASLKQRYRQISRCENVTFNSRQSRRFLLGNKSYSAGRKAIGKEHP